MTSRQLVLVRHSKAAEGTTDVQRPLAPRGLRDATAIGAWLARHALIPDQVAVSNAVRAAQTWQQAAASLRPVPPVTEDERIYGNTVEALLAVIGDTGSDVRTLAVVGHNPSMGELAHELDDRTGDRDARAELDRGFPTSAVAVFAFDRPWDELGPRTATLTHFSAPRG